MDLKWICKQCCCSFPENCGDKELLKHLLTIHPTQYIECYQGLYLYFSKQNPPEKVGVSPTQKENVRSVSLYKQTWQDKMYILLLRAKNVWKNIRWALSIKTSKQKASYLLFKALNQLQKIDDNHKYFLAKAYVSNAIRELTKPVERKKWKQNIQKTH